MPDIHATAVVHEKAKVADDAVIGPYAIIGAEVEIGVGARIAAHAVIDGATRIGRNVQVFPFASIGSAPQDKKYRGERSTVTIGDDVVIREYVTVNPGTEGGDMTTVVGDRCLLMIGSHVAHDCVVGDDVIVGNNVLLGGHVRVETFAILSGGAAVHQFCRIGRHAMIGGLTGVERDVIPYGQAMGNRARLTGLNLIGLKRRGFERSVVQDLRTAYRLLFAEEGTLAERVEDVKRRFGEVEAVKEVIDFIEADSSRSFCQPHPGGEA